MSSDKTWFDEKLKGNLYYDICFRAFIWLAISIIALRHAVARSDFSPVAAFSNSMENLLPVVSDVTRAAFVVCIAALILKDLEHVAPLQWGQDTFIGRIGGVVRRLAGDLSNWILGALITFLASFVLLATFINQSGAWSDGTRSFVAVMAVFFAVSIPAFSVVNVWIRRDLSLVSSHAKFVEMCNSPSKVLGFYLTLGVVTVLFS